MSMSVEDDGGVNTSAMLTGPLERVLQNAPLSSLIESVVGVGVLSTVALNQLTTAVTYNSETARTMASIASMELTRREAQRARPGRVRYVLKGCADQSARKKIEQLFASEFDIHYAPSAASICHPVPKFCRELSWMIMCTMMSVSPGARTLLVGENAEYAIAHANGLNIVKVCAPNLSFRDEATRNRLSDAERLDRAVRQGLFPASLVGKYNEVLSRDRLEDNTVLADQIILRDVYDISLVQIAEGANASMAKDVVYSIIVPDGLMTRFRDPNKPQEEVYIPEIDAHYRLIVEKGEVTKIHFSMGGPVMGYTHDIDTYLSLIRERTVDTPHGRFVNVLAKKYGPIHIFRLQFVGQSHVEVQRPIEMVEGQETAIIRTFRYRSGPRDSEKSYDPIFIQVPAVDFYRLCSHIAMDPKADGPDKVQNAIRMLRAIQKSIIFFTEEMRQSARTDPEELFPLATAAIIYVARNLQIAKAKTLGATRAIRWRRTLNEHFFWQLHPMDYLKVTEATFGTIVTGLYDTINSIPFFSQLAQILDMRYAIKLYRLFFSPDAFDTRVAIIKTIRFCDEALEGSLGSQFQIASLVSDKTFDYRLPLPLDEDYDEMSAPLLPEEESVLSGINPVLLDDFDRNRPIRNAWMGDSVEEYRKICASEMKDVTAACLQTELHVFSTGKVNEVLVNQSWQDASAMVECVRVIKVEQGRVVGVYPSDAREPLSSMFWVPLGNYDDPSLWVTDFGEPVIGLNIPDLPPGIEWFYAQNKIAIYNTPVFLRQMGRFDGFSTFDVNMRLYEGVFGAGKTYQLINSTPEECLVLSISSKNKEELEEKMRERYPDFPRQRVRTLDSYLVNPNVRAENVFIDEGFMAHSGQIALALYFAFGASSDVNGTVHIYGDRPQIPWINRGTVTGIDHAQMPNYIFDETRFFDTSLRCSMETVSRYGDCYNSPIFTTSMVRWSKAWVTIRDISEVPVLKNTQYLTYTRSDKKVVANYLRSQGYKVVTKSKDKVTSDRDLRVNVHAEVQGMTYPAVITVRTGVEAQALIDNPKFQLVDGSRETHAHLYCTILTAANADSSLKRFMRRIVEEEIKSVWRDRPEGADEPLVLHTERDCKCGGDRHPLVELCRSIRMSASGVA